MTGLSKQAQAFIDEIEDVCRKHGISMSCNGYDSLQLWEIKEGYEILAFNGIEDCTQLLKDSQ